MRTTEVEISPPVAAMAINPSYSRWMKLTILKPHTKTYDVLTAGFYEASEVLIMSEHSWASPTDAAVIRVSFNTTGQRATTIDHCCFGHYSTIVLYCSRDVF